MGKSTISRKAAVLPDYGRGPREKKKKKKKKKLTPQIIFV
jgi:hypothetical protein